MFVILKSIGGNSYRLKNGKKIVLKGGCYANDLSIDDFKMLKDEFPIFSRSIEKGFIVVNGGDKAQAISKAVDETKQADLDKQTQAQDENAKRTNARVKKG